MSIELRMLSFSILLGIAQILLAAQASTKQRGIKWNLSSRDDKQPELTGIAGRLDRAYKNFMETFAFFMGAVLIVTLLNASTTTSAMGAQLYLFARMAYLPVYAAGVKGLRTLIWLASFIGILMVLSALL